MSSYIHIKGADGKLYRQPVTVRTPRSSGVPALVIPQVQAITSVVTKTARSSETATVLDGGDVTHVGLSGFSVVAYGVYKVSGAFLFSCSTGGAFIAFEHPAALEPSYSGFHVDPDDGSVGGLQTSNDQAETYTTLGDGCTAEKTTVWWPFEFLYHCGASAGTMGVVFRPLGTGINDTGVVIHSGSYINVELVAVVNPAS